MMSMLFKFIIMDANIQGQTGNNIKTEKTGKKPGKRNMSVHDRKSKGLI